MIHYNFKINSKKINRLFSISNKIKIIHKACKIIQIIKIIQNQNL